MAIGWLLPRPAAAGAAAAAGWLAFTGPIGVVIVALVLIAASAGIYAASRRSPVTAQNVNDVPAREPATATA
jgi:PiT family inorganic phosphate transporter